MNGSKGIYIGGTLISILISLAQGVTGRRESAIFCWALGTDYPQLGSEPPRERLESTLLRPDAEGHSANIARGDSA